MQDAGFTHHTSHITHHTSHITHHTSHITHHTSHITHHTSHISHLTSHISRHTSHISRLKSHVSRLTSHVSSPTSNIPNQKNPNWPKPYNFFLYFCGLKKMRRSLNEPKWWNGRHEGLKIPCSLRACGFKSHLRYQNRKRK